MLQIVTWKKARAYPYPWACVLDKHVFCHAILDTLGQNVHAYPHQDVISVHSSFGSQAPPHPSVPSKRLAQPTFQHAPCLCVPTLSLEFKGYVTFCCVLAKLHAYPYPGGPCYEKNTNVMIFATGCMLHMACRVLLVSSC